MKIIEHFRHVFVKSGLILNGNKIVIYISFALLIAWKPISYAAGSIIF